MPADALTLALVEALERDPRASVISLATTLGVSRPAVQERLDRLVASGQLRVTVTVLPQSGGEPTAALYGLAVAPALRRAAGEALARVGGAHSVQRLAGRYDFLVAADVPGLRDVATFADTHLAPLPGLQVLDTFLGLSMVKSRYLHVGEEVDDMPPRPAGRSLDETDLRILARLAEDGRMPWSEISRLEAIPTPTVRRRVMAAQEAGAIRFGVVADPGLRRQGMQAFLAFRVLPGAAPDLAAVLKPDAALERIRTLAGPFGVIALGRYPDPAALEAHAARLAHLPGVAALEVWPVLEPLRRLGVETVPPS